MRARWCNDAEGPGRATLVAAFLASLPAAAHAALGGGASEEMRLAYIDPGSGSFLVQALVATAAGVAVALRLYWKRVKSLFGIVSDDDDDDDAPMAGDVDEPR